MITITTPRGAENYYPHYWSTYCIHGRHNECRRTCKTCEAPCRCECHDGRFGARNDGEAGA